MSSAGELAQAHWSRTPLFYAERDRYRFYPWLYEVGEFRHHRGERVLEIGCGTGCDLLQFFRHGAIVTGVDITERHLELARERMTGMVNLVRADGSRLPFRNARFDYVYSHGVLHHSNVAHLISREILRVLKPEGRFNIHVYARYSVAVLNYIRLFGTDWKRHVENSTDPVHLDLYTASDLRRLFPDIPLDIRKYEIHRRLKGLERWLGWFLVATGQKPG